MCIHESRKFHSHSGILPRCRAAPIPKKCAATETNSFIASAAYRISLQSGTDSKKFAASETDSFKARVKYLRLAAQHR